MESKRILLIDDSEEIGELIKSGLEAYYVEHARSVLEAMQSLRNAHFDLFLVDVTLPDGNGFDFCLKLKEFPDFAKVPKIILTARDEVAEKVYGFNCGADDYITKPFHTLELRARVDRHLARTQHDRHELEKSIPGLELDLEFQVCRSLDHGQKVDLKLTPTEFRLLVTLIKNQGRVLSRPELEQIAWQIFGTSIERRGIDTHIAHLRKKLGVQRECIVSVYGQGYTFKVPA